ncbi:septum formation inhibitor Maf, partial [bacterium]|nr:septum formation inhibitor Maf [bacterium]
VKDESDEGTYEVLKMNFMREFLTGVYPYHTMVSVFQPLEEKSVGKALKVTTSVQEWCGSVFMQTNRREGVLRTELKSYFEKEEGGVFEEKSSVMLEDEVWTSLRVDPTALPVGEVKMVPGSLHLRLTHAAPVAATATTRWLAGQKEDTAIYEITYPGSGRTLAIEIQKTLPYSIQGWKESNKRGLLSSGVLKNQERNVDYWNYSGESKGKKLRSKLGFQE